MERATKIHSINPDDWNAHAALGRALERTTTESKVVVGWYDEELKQIRFIQSCTDLEAHFMCAKIAHSILAAE